MKTLTTLTTLTTLIAVVATSFALNANAFLKKWYKIYEYDKLISAFDAVNEAQSGYNNSSS